MRIYQTWRDYLAQVVLVREPPVIDRLFRRWLVGLHTDFFVGASERDGSAREPHLRALFEGSLNAYVRATKEGYPEAQAREITHVLATWDFVDHGWGELIEYPPEEASEYYERYRDFYERHGCSPGNPLGEFEPPGGLPDAPETPDRLNGDYPLAEPGLADDVYIMTEDLGVRVPDGTAAKGEVDATR